jgi:hypothetical protein
LTKIASYKETSRAETSAPKPIKREPPDSPRQS